MKMASGYDNLNNRNKVPITRHLALKCYRKKLSSFQNNIHNNLRISLISFICGLS